MHYYSLFHTEKKENPLYKKKYLLEEYFFKNFFSKPDFNRKSYDSQFCNNVHYYLYFVTAVMLLGPSVHAKRNT